MRMPLVRLAGALAAFLFLASPLLLAQTTGTIRGVAGTGHDPYAAHDASSDPYRRR